MSSIAMQGGATGSGTVTLLAPSTSTNRTLTLPDDTGTVATAESTLTQFNATGSAPVYACRAWVNFNGTGTIAIRASGNVSSITDNGTGYYRVNFATAMPDSNYCIAGCPSDDGIAATVISSSGTWGGTNQTATSALMFVGVTGAGNDRTGVSFAFFR